MQHYLGLPNPLARLTRLIAFVEEAPSEETRANDNPITPVSWGEPLPEEDRNGPDELEMMSLTRSDAFSERARDDLAFFSLSRMENDIEGSPDALSALSLTSVQGPIPPRSAYLTRRPNRGA